MKCYTISLFIFLTSTGVLTADLIGITIKKPSNKDGIKCATFHLPEGKKRVFSFQKEFYPTMQLPAGTTINVSIEKSNGKNYQTSFITPAFDSQILTFKPNGLSIKNAGAQFYKAAKYLYMIKADT